MITNIYTTTSNDNKNSEHNCYIYNDSKKDNNNHHFYNSNG